MRPFNNRKLKRGEYCQFETREEMQRFVAHQRMLGNPLHEGDPSNYGILPEYRQIGWKREVGTGLVQKVDHFSLYNYTLIDPYKKETFMNIKETATKLRSYIQPYERYLFMAALLIALDHFLLKGAMRERILELGRNLANRLTAALDSAIAKLSLPGGEK